MTVPPCGSGCIMVPPVAIILLLSLVLVTPCHAQPQPRRVTVHTPSGSISGLVTVTRGGVTINQFRGIPYAEPPLADLRFKKPVPVPPWSNTLDATEFGDACPQGGGGAGTSEDCLFLNVYVRATDTDTDSDSGRDSDSDRDRDRDSDSPSRTEGSHRPSSGSRRAVMVWVHGGGFVAGSGRTSDGSRMAAEGEVVVVTLNYRLGMLGWLSTLDTANPGNYGLWDQRMALGWVKDNIGAFGGDPGQITVFGDSAGGYSVGLHALSPLNNNGLFQRAIMMSGNALCRRTLALDPVGFAGRFGRQLGCLRRTAHGFDSGYLLDCARQRSVAAILNATAEASRPSRLAWLLPVAPVIDGHLVPADVRTLLGPAYQDTVPFWGLDIMVGTTNGEGSLVLSPLLPFQDALGINLADGIPTQVLCANVTPALARDYFPGSGNVSRNVSRDVSRDVSRNVSRDVSRALCEQYTARRGGAAQQGRDVVSLYGDMMFVSAAVETLQRHANVTDRHANVTDRHANVTDRHANVTDRHANVTGGRGAGRRFQYLFSYAPGAGSAAFPWFRGAGHYSDVRLVFGMSLRGRAERRLSRAVMAAWTNFAKFGTPNDPHNPGTYQWPEYDLVDKAYTDLDLEVTSARDLYSQRMQFWLHTLPSLDSGVTSVTSVTPAPQVSPNTSVTMAMAVGGGGDGSSSSSRAAVTGGRGGGMFSLEVGLATATMAMCLALYKIAVP